MLTTILLLLTSIYLCIKFLQKYINGNNDFWPSRGVPVVLQSEYATFFELMRGTKDFKSMDQFCYDKDKNAPFIGTMELRTPTLMVRDLDLLNKICIKDFDYFMDHRKLDLGGPLSDKLLGNMHGQAWKEMRMVMSPLFTTSKIRRIFEQFEKSSQNMVDHVKGLMEKNHGSAIIDPTRLYHRFAMDVIASAAFGMDSQCFKSDDSPFLKMATKLADTGMIKILVLMYAPRLAKILGITIFNKEAFNFFRSVVDTTVQNRRTKGGYHADFLQLMLEVQTGNEAREDEKGGKNVVDEELDAFEKDAQLKPPTSTAGERAALRFSSLKTITDDGILANAIVFFLAGLDTVQSVMTFASYQLAVSPDMQDRLREEIEEVRQEYGGQINYDGLSKMTYLDMFLTELTRLYPPAHRTDRLTMMDYQIPGTKIVIPAGTIVNIPIWAIQMDEKYFPEPQKFDPERFSAGNKANKNLILAFGQGPRSCIGKRLALTETKAAIAHLIVNFDISPCTETQIPIKLNMSSMVLKPAEGFKISLKPRH